MLSQNIAKHFRSSHLNWNLARILKQDEHKKKSPKNPFLTQIWFSIHGKVWTTFSEFMVQNVLICWLYGKAKPKYLYIEKRSKYLFIHKCQREAPKMRIHEHFNIFGVWKYWACEALSNTIPTTEILSYALYHHKTHSSAGSNIINTKLDS